MRTASLLLLLACRFGPADPVAAMDAFVHETHGATQQLTQEGSDVANALFDVTESKADVAAVRSEVEEGQKEIERQRARLDQWSGPTTPEFEGYRTALRAHLDGQEELMSVLWTEGIPIATGAGNPAERGQQILELIQRHHPAEQATASAAEEAMRRLYATF